MDTGAENTVVAKKIEGTCREATAIGSVEIGAFGFTGIFITHVDSP